MTLQNLVSIAGGPFTGKGVLLAVRLSRDSKSNCDDGSLVFSKCLPLLPNTVPWRSTLWQRGSTYLTTDSFLHNLSLSISSGFMRTVSLG